MDADPGGQLEAIRDPQQGQGILAQPILRWGQGAAIDGDGLKLQLLPVQAQLAVSAHRRGVAPKGNGRLDPGGLGVQLAAQVDMLDQELWRPVIFEVDGTGCVAVHGSLRGSRLAAGRMGLDVCGRRLGQGGLWSGRGTHIQGHRGGSVQAQPIAPHRARPVLDPSCGGTRPQTSVLMSPGASGDFQARQIVP